MKSYDNIGGWLAVFRILTWMGVVGFAVYEICEALLFILKRADYFNTESLICFIINLVIFAILLRIALLIQKKAPDTPTHIANLLIVIAVFGILSYFYSLHISEDATPPRGIVWAVIWILYFNKSKRVNAYYGNNAFHVAKRNNAQPVSSEDSQH